MAEVVGGTLGRSFRRNEQAVFLAAAALVVFLTVIAPLLQLLATVPNGAAAGVALLASAQVWLLLGRSLLLAAAVTAMALAMGAPLGVLFGRTDVPLRRLLWLVHGLPMFLPPFLPALGWFHWLGTHGLAGSETTARVLFSEAGVVLVLGTVFAPVVSSLVALAVMGVDPSLEEAARLVARPWRVATRILLSAASPAIALAGVIVYSLALSELGVPMFLRVDVFPTAVFARLGGVDFAPGEAMALALPLAPIALALIAIERRFASRRSFVVLGLRAGEVSRLPLRRWRLPALLACVTAAAVSAGPLSALVARSAPWSREAPALLEWAREAPRNGLMAAAAAATAIAVLALVAGHAVSRGLRGSSAIDGVCVLGFVMPAAVLGVGLAALWNRPSTQFVYGTMAIVVLGYVARYAVIGVRVVACAVAQSPVHLEEAAASLGARFGRRLLHIVLPLHARGVAFAWLLTLVFCLRDLETAILFYPPGGEPLTVRIFTLEANGPPAVVAGLCVLHLAITAAALSAGMLLVRRQSA